MMLQCRGPKIFSECLQFNRSTFLSHRKLLWRGVWRSPARTQNFREESTAAGLKVTSGLDLRDDIPPPSRKRISLPKLSPEQEKARQILSTDDGNVIINACAGSGKTTTLLQMGKLIKKSFLVLLYNKRLRAETIERANSLELTNMTIDNYHGLGYRYYTPECATDQGLKRVVQDDLPPLSKLPLFDVLVLDEQQDMNPLIFLFVKKLFKDAAEQGQKMPQMLLLGDPRQEIYQFNNADKRFLTLCKDLFPQSEVVGKSPVPRKWTQLEHRTSYRLTKQIAAFINKQLLRQDKQFEILTIKNQEDNPKPRYVVCDAFSESPLKELLRLIDLGVPPSDILILGPSLRSSRNALRVLANNLAIKYPSIQMYIPSDDAEEISPQLGLGKVTFASYHQAKGIERDAVILFSFDDSYHRFFDRNVKDFETVGNAQYVAATRAKTHLIMIHHCNSDYLPFITPSTLKTTCEVIRHQKVTVIPVSETPRAQWAVTDLTRNIPESVISTCFGILELELLNEPKFHRKYPDTKIEVADGIFEGVSEITGTAVPAIFEWQNRQTCSLLDEVMGCLERKTMPEPFRLLPTKYLDHLRAIDLRRKEEEVLNIGDILFVANISNMLQSGFINKVISIPMDRYTWFTEDHAKAAYKVLQYRIARGSRYEQSIGHTFEEVEAFGKPVHVRGRVDNIDFGRTWELKWTNTLRPENILQVALYGAIELANFRVREKQREMKKILKVADDDEKDEDEKGKEEKERKPRVCKLLHVPTGQIVEVKPKVLAGGKDGFVELLRTLVRAKVEEPALVMSDKMFVNEARRGFGGLVGEMTVPAWLNTSSWSKKVKGKK